MVGFVFLTACVPLSEFDGLVFIPLAKNVLSGLENRRPKRVPLGNHS